MKKALSALLALVLVLCIGITSVGAEDDRFDKYEEPITISFLSVDRNYTTVAPYDPNDPAKKSATENTWITGFSDYLNINLDYICVEDETALNARINTAMASNTLPDIIRCSKSMFYTLAENGALQDMRDVWNGFEKNHMLEYCTGKFSDYLAAGTIDGEVLGLGDSGAFYNSNGVLWIRNDWLKKVDMEAPKTLDEMIAVAQAFIDAGLGGDHTIGIGNYSNNYFRDIFNAYGVLLGMWVPEGEDGKYIYANTQPETKDALLKLQDMYKQGLFQQDFATAGTIAEEISNGHCGMFYGTATTAVMAVKTNINYDETSDWMMYYIPTLDGERVLQNGVGSQLSNFYCVTTACEHPEALLKLLEFCMEIRYEGSPEEMEHFLFNADGYEMWSLNPFRDTTPSDFDLWRGALVRDGLANGTTLEEFNPVCKTQYSNALKAMDGDRSGLPHYLAYAIGFGTMYNYLLDNGYLYNDYNGPLTENMSLYQTTINEALNAALVKVIMGEDYSVYEEAIKTWYNAGGQAITDDVNAYYDSLK